MKIARSRYLSPDVWCCDPSQDAGRSDRTGLVPWVSRCVSFAQRGFLVCCGGL